MTGQPPAITFLLLEFLDVGEKKTLLVLLFAFFGVFAYTTGMVEIPPPGSEPDRSVEVGPTPDVSFVDLLRGELRGPEFTLFTAAADSIGFWAEVAAAAPATLFVPTNDAFDRLPRGAAQELIDNPERLARLLRYHLLPRLLAPSQFADVGGAMTALEIPIAFTLDQSAAFAGYATIDLGGVRFVNAANNGNGDADGTSTAAAANAAVVVFPVDAVLLPPERLALDLLTADPELSILSDAVGAVGLDRVLAEQQGITLFAPSNAAFSRLPAGELDELLANPRALLITLQHHLALGWLLLGDLQQTPEITSIGGRELMVSPSGDSVTIDRLADVIEANIIATNGAIHVIDRVILPQGE